MSALLLGNLGVICPSCDFLNVVGAAKCVTCGTNVASDGAATAKSEAKAEPAAPAKPMPPQPSEPPGLKRTNTKDVPIPAVAAKPPPASEKPTKPVNVPPAAPPPPPAVAAAIPAPATTAPSPPPAGAVPAPAAGPKFALNVIAGPARGQKFRVGANGAQIGRGKGVVLFPDDPFVSPLHASVVVKDGRVTVRDEGSTSGVYVSIQGQETIPPDCYFATGLRLFRYVGALEPAPPYVPGRMTVYGAPVPPNQVHYQVEEILLGDRPGKAVITAGPILTIGQSKCDLSYANEEGLAPRHCELSPMPTGAMIRDLSGGLGTYIRVKGERPLKAGDRIRIGQQTLQLEAL
jgi:pSer/pThr/pTyr-binding forkhead associated (FHA) protein